MVSAGRAGLFSRMPGDGWNLGLLGMRGGYRRTQALLHRVVELVAVVAGGRVGAGCVERAFGEDRLKCLFDEAFPVFGGLPRLVHSENAVLVEARAVVDESVRASLGVDAIHPSVVVDGAAVVAGLELSDVGVCQWSLLDREGRSYAVRTSLAESLRLPPLVLVEEHGVQAWGGRQPRACDHSLTASQWYGRPGLRVGGIAGRATGGGPLARAPRCQCLTPNSVMTVDIWPGFSALQPLSLPPAVIAEEHGAELGERVRWVFERGEQYGAFGESEREKFDLVGDGAVEPVGKVASAVVPQDPCELDDCGVGDGAAGEHHRGEAT
jgi:hypothetical protein